MQAVSREIMAGPTTRLPGRSRTWLLVGYKKDSREARRLAAVAQAIYARTEGQLPVAFVSALGVELTSDLVGDLELSMPICTDDGAQAVLEGIHGCPCAFLAVIEDDHIVDAACADCPEAIVDLSCLALRRVGIDNLNPTFARELLAPGSPEIESPILGLRMQESTTFSERR